MHVYNMLILYHSRVVSVKRINGPIFTEFQSSDGQLLCDFYCPGAGSEGGGSFFHFSMILQPNLTRNAPASPQRSPRTAPHSTSVGKCTNRYIRLSPMRIEITRAIVQPRWRMAAMAQVAAKDTAVWPDGKEKSFSYGTRSSSSDL